MTKKSTAQKTSLPKSKDLPATRGILQLVRTELKADIRELRSEMKSEFFSVRADLAKTDAKIEKVHSDVARIGVLLEEQNANNRIVLEGLSGLWHRQEKFEARLTDEVERGVAMTVLRAKT